MAKALGALGPTILITNGTVFGPRRFARATELAGHDVALQISLDAPEPDPTTRCGDGRTSPRSPT